VRDLKPSCLEDISSILALYRPGPLDAGLIPQFINQKHGREKNRISASTARANFARNLRNSVFQEQIMRMAQDLAGYSLGQADCAAQWVKEGFKCRSSEIFINGALKWN